MAIIENRTKTTSHLLEFVRFSIFTIKRFFVLAFIILSFNFLYFAAPQKLSNITLEIAGRFISTGLAVYDGALHKINALTAKFIYFSNLEAENVELKLEISRLKTLLNDAKLIKAENAALKNFLTVIPESNHQYLITRVLSVSLTPYSKTAIIAAGTRHDIAIDQIVTNHQGLIGRVIEVSDNYSKVMLVNDLNSRIPVISLASRERGIIAGNNQQTKMIYLPENHLLQEGEIIITSGDGKIYPYGVAVARVTAINKEGDVLVEPIADLQKTDFVMVHH